MRHLLFAMLVAAPTALVTWMITRGAACPRQSIAAQVASKPAPAATAKPASPKTEATPAAHKAVFATPLPGTLLRGNAAYYDTKGLFEYIDGAAPRYIQHGFVQLAAAELAIPSGSELTCDVYAMKDAQGATAIYAAESSKQAQPLPVGDEGRVSKMAVSFRSGPYYVKLTAFDANAEAALPSIAKAVAARLQ